MDERERVRTVDALTRQIDEIKAVKPKPGEDEKLSKKLALYEHGEKIAQAVGSAYAYVYRGEGRTLAAQDALSRASQEMASIAELDVRFEALRARLEELFYAAQDAGSELQRIQDSLDYDPAAADLDPAGEAYHRRLRLPLAGRLLVRPGDADDLVDPRQRYQSRAVDRPVVPDHPDRGANPADHRTRLESHLLDDGGDTAHIRVTRAALHHDQHVRTFPRRKRGASCKGQTTPAQPLMRAPVHARRGARPRWWTRRAPAW
jgi:hypothetical protein